MFLNFSGFYRKTGVSAFTVATSMPLHFPAKLFVYSGLKGSQQKNRRKSENHCIYLEMPLSSPLQERTDQNSPLAAK